MKARWNFEPIGRFVIEQRPTLIFGAGLSVLCLSVAQWSAPAAGVIAGVTLMLIGAMPGVKLSRAVRKD